MNTITYNGELYVLESDCRLAVNEALATNVARNAAIDTLRVALTQIATKVEFGTSGRQTIPKCKSAALTVDAATNLKGTISDIARQALWETEDLGK